jgi:hypothetical protein
LLNKVKLAGADDLAETTNLNNSRDRIKRVRQFLATNETTRAKIKKLPASMLNQWTRDLFETLVSLPN